MTVRERQFLTKVSDLFLSSQFIEIMTTRQTGGLNKGYKPTSPASA
ncbi:hypothetical protein ACTGU3_11845 [Streptococcus suis]